MNRILNWKLFSHIILKTSLHCLSAATEKCDDILIVVLLMVAFSFWNFLGSSFLFSTVLKFQNDVSW